MPGLLPPPSKTQEAGTMRLQLPHVHRAGHLLLSSGYGPCDTSNSTDADLNIDAITMNTPTRPIQRSSFWCWLAIGFGNGWVLVALVALTVLAALALVLVLGMGFEGMDSALPSLRCVFYSCPCVIVVFSAWLAAYNYV